MERRSEIGFTVIVAALTLVVAIVAGFFLIREPADSSLVSGNNGPSSPQVSMIASDVKRGPDTTKPSSGPRPGINPAPRPVQ
ncbi:MAG TPA: hypothetical protein VHT51_03675 [Micropepsaceae bacterium]|nr:hypothetical protein [Micropepsaceae bacterium]